MSTIERKDVLAEPEGFVPDYDELLEAVRASAFWAEAEHQTLGSFYDRMDLCAYAEWCCGKALGRPHDDEFRGVPQIILRRQP